MSYQQLSLNERQRIYALKYEDCLSVRAIGRLLKRAASTISRELYRNICHNRCPTKSLKTALSKSVF